MAPALSTLRSHVTEDEIALFCGFIENESKTRKRKIFTLLAMAEYVESKGENYSVINKKPNLPRNRDVICSKILRLSDEDPALFKKMYRLDREDFFKVLALVRPSLTKDWRKSGSRYPIDPLIKLAITLRFLAGGIYLDLAWGYDIPPGNIHQYVIETLTAIDESKDPFLNNIHFDMGNAEELAELENGM